MLTIACGSSHTCGSSPVTCRLATTSTFLEPPSRQPAPTNSEQTTSRTTASRMRRHGTGRKSQNGCAPCGAHPFRSGLRSALSGLESLDQGRQDLVDVTHDAEV